MELYLKIAVAAIVTAVLGAVLAKDSRASALIVSLTACVVFLAATASLYGSLRSRFSGITAAAGFAGDTIGTLLKVCLIGIITQFCEAFCRESGSPSVGKAAEICGSFAALYVSLPLLEAVWAVLRTLLGG